MTSTEMIRDMLGRQKIHDVEVFKKHNITSISREQLESALLDELDYIVYASKLYGGKHVMEELNQRYRDKLMN